MTLAEAFYVMPDKMQNVPLSIDNEGKKWWLTEVFERPPTPEAPEGLLLVYSVWTNKEVIG
jgi:hypothetical protein